MAFLIKKKIPQKCMVVISDWQARFRETNFSELEVPRNFLRESKVSLGTLGAYHEGRHGASRGSHGGVTGGRLALPHGVGRARAGRRSSFASFACPPPPGIRRGGRTPRSPWTCWKWGQSGRGVWLGPGRSGGGGARGVGRGGRGGGGPLP